MKSIIILAIAITLAIPLFNHAFSIPDMVKITVIAVQDGEVVYKDGNGMIGIYRDYNHSCDEDTWQKLLAIDTFPVKVTLYSSNNDKFDKVMVTREGGDE
jgi:hypothetical protein